MSRPFRTEKDYLIDARLGNVPNTSVTTIVGIAESTITSSVSTMWDEGTVYSFPSAATVMTVSSSSANDTLGGTGAQYVYIEYLDANYVEQTLTLALNGQSGVSTVVSILRVNLFRVVYSGTGKTNAGNIFLGTGAISSGKPATVYGRISAGRGAAQQGVFTVPAATECLFVNIGATSSSSKEVDISVEISVDLTNTFAEVLRYHMYNNTLNAQAFGRPVPAKSDIRFNATTSTGTGDATLSIGILLIRSAEANQRV